MCIEIAALIFVLLIFLIELGAYIYIGFKCRRK